MAEPFQWNFEPHTVNFKLSLKAAFHPSLADACLVIPWLDGAAVGKGEPPTFGSEITVRLGGGDEDEGKAGKKPADKAAAKGRKDSVTPQAPQAGGLDRARASVEKELGSFSVTLDLVHSLQRATLPVAVRLPAGPDGARPADSGGARICLAPLLLAGSSEDHSAAGGSGAFRGRPAWVVAAGTDRVGVAGLHKWELRISTDAPVLSRPMLERLRPLSLTLEAVRGLPNEPELAEACDDVYLEVYPHLSATTQALAEECPRVRTASRPHNRDIHFGDQLVWFLGRAQPEVVRSWMAHEGLVVEVHDRDLRPPPPKEGGSPSSSSQPATGAEAKRIVHPHGVARVLLAPLLESKSLAETLRVGVHPARGDKKRRRAEAMATGLPAKGLLDNQAELEDAIKARLDKREDTSDYHLGSVACTVRASLAVPLPAAEDVRRAAEDGQRQRWESSEVRLGEESNIWQAQPRASATPEPVATKSLKGGKEPPQKAAPQPEAGAAADTPPQASGPLPFRAKLPLPGGGELVGPWRPRREDAEADEERLFKAFAPGRRLAVQDSDGDALARSLTPNSKKKKGKATKHSKEELEAQKAAEAAEAARREAAARAVCEELHAEVTHGLDLRYERYGRLVLVVRESEVATIQAVLRAVRAHNGGLLGVGPDSPELRTLRLTEEQKADPHLDLLTGFACLEGWRRVMVVEGLRDRGLQAVVEAVPNRLARRNGADYKLLYNPSVRFANRLYGDFGPTLKQIKMKQSLQEIASRPELYSTSGMAGGDVLTGIEAPKLLVDMTMAEKMKALHQASSWPTPGQLVNFEILYGGYVSDGELEADPSLDQVAHADARKQLKASASFPDLTQTVTLPSEAKTIKMVETVEMLGAARAPAARAVAAKRAPLDMTNAAHKEAEMRRSASAPDMIKRNIATLKEMSDSNVKLNNVIGKKRSRETPFLDGKEVFIYSSQRLNCAEQQKDWMRKHMEKDWKTKLYTHSLTHEAMSFDISGKCPPGVREWESSVPNNSYANLPGDDRPPWRGLDRARPKEDFRKPPRDIDVAQQEELRQPFVDNEWHHLAMGQERRRPVEVHRTFDPNRVPHHRTTTDRPFDPALCPSASKEFGPKSSFESVFYFGRRPGEGLQEEAIANAAEEQRAADAKVLGARAMGTFTKGSTRQGITDLDRCEPMAKGVVEGGTGRGGLRALAAFPVSLRTLEPYHDNGNPAKEFHCRLRENDCSAPYDVTTGGYVPRDSSVGTKTACMSGKLGKAPWRHGAEIDRTAPLPPQYVSPHNFDLTRPPPTSKACEAHLSKSASRKTVSFQEKASTAAYARPASLRAAAAPA